MVGIAKNGQPNQSATVHRHVRSRPRMPFGRLLSGQEIASEGLEDEEQHAEEHLAVPL